MQAVLCLATGNNPNLCVTEVGDQPLRPNQIRIRVKAAGMNFPDYLMVTGRYQVRPTPPFTPGLEAAGEIIELGSQVKVFSLGQRVIAVSRRGGCFATRLAVDANRAVLIPETMDYVTAACFPIAYGTSHFALTHRGHLRRGETLVVTGAAGGLGLAAVEIGKQLGARVIAAASSPERLALAKQCGADAFINYSQENVNTQIKALTDGAGADVIFDTVGGDVFDHCVRAVNWEGRLLVVGFAAGRIPQIPTNLILVKNYSVIGVAFGAQSERDPKGTADRLALLLQWYADGRLHPLPAKVFPLQQAVEAILQFPTHSLVGKLALSLE